MQLLSEHAFTLGHDEKSSPLAGKREEKPARVFALTRDHEKISGPKGWRNQRIVTSKIFDDLIGRSFESNKQPLSARVSYRSRCNLKLGFVETTATPQAV